VDPLRKPVAKLFASCYALFQGLLHRRGILVGGAIRSPFIASLPPCRTIKETRLVQGGVTRASSYHSVCYVLYIIVSQC